MILISYKKLKEKLVELGYNKAEIKSTTKQIRRFDKDLKKAVYNWLKEGVVPGDDNPKMLVNGEYSVRRLSEELDFQIPAAFIVLQTSRRDPARASEMIAQMSTRDSDVESNPFGFTKEEIKEMCERFGIPEKDEPEEDQEDIAIEDTSENKEGGQNNG